jgi:two-component system chemotaxis response regulator CheB
VLIVDDSAPIRILLHEALSSDPGVTVVGTAANGELALLAVRTQRPDVIILDLEMPVMDGMEFLAEVRRTAPRLPVLVFSSFSSHGAEITLKALWAGASDYVTKPRAQGIEQAREAVAAALLPRIHAIAGRERERASRARMKAAPVAARAESDRAAARPRQRARAVFVAASTGGPRALAAMLRALPADLPVPVVIVQHMPAMFTGYLAHGLASQCALKVSEAWPGARLEPGQVWIAPGDRHLTVRLSARGLEAQVLQGPHENGCRPSADPLFRSAAETFGHTALAIVLTGMGQDGMLGARAVHDAGGTVIVQDEASSVIWGMPGSVARAGLADRVLPLEGIAPEIVARCDRGRRHAA